jgi:hypothetical protein
VEQNLSDPYDGGYRGQDRSAQYWGLVRSATNYDQALSLFPSLNHLRHDGSMNGNVSMSHDTYLTETYPNYDSNRYAVNGRIVMNNYPNHHASDRSLYNSYGRNGYNDRHHVHNDYDSPPLLHVPNHYEGYSRHMPPLPVNHYDEKRRYGLVQRDPVSSSRQKNNRYNNSSESRSYHYEGNKRKR